MRWMIVIVGALSLTIVLSGCASFLGKLRNDLDDRPPPAPEYEPTYGGVWTERGLMNQPYDSVGHHEREPASQWPPGSPQSENTWVGTEQQDANMRDRYRASARQDGTLKYSQNPNMPPRVRRQYKNGKRATAEDFVDSSQNEGSLWASEGQTNYFFVKNKIKSVGDILQITIAAPVVKDIQSEVKKTLNREEVISELARAQEKINRTTMADYLKKKKTLDAKRKIASKEKPKEKEKEGETIRASRKKEQKPEKMPEIEYPQASFDDIDVTDGVEVEPGLKIFGEIIKRYPNGNYKVRGTKKINFRGKPRLMSLVGIAKDTDISEEGEVDSGNLYEYQVRIIR